MHGLSYRLRKGLITKKSLLEAVDTHGLQVYADVLTQHSPEGSHISVVYRETRRSNDKAATVVTLLREAGFTVEHRLAKSPCTGQIKVFAIDCNKGE